MADAGHNTRAHAKLSASGRYMWVACPGSAQAQDGLPGSSSPAAEEGTAAHELAEACLEAAEFSQQPLDIAPAETFIGKRFNVGNSVKPEGYEVDAQMANHVQTYLDAIKQDWISYGGTLLVEHRFDLSAHIASDMFGTNDAALVGCTAGKAFVYDLKYGSGQTVEVTGNKQLEYYGLGLTYNFDKGRKINTVELVIVQPRKDHPDGPVRRWKRTVGEMIDAGFEMLAEVDAALMVGAPRFAGDHCKYCLAKPTCPMIEKAALENTALAFADDGHLEGDPLFVSDETDPVRLGQIMTALPVLETWMKGVKEEVFKRLQRGDGVPGYKLVAKPRKRVFADEDEARRALLGADIPEALVMTAPVPAKLRTPAQIETSIGKTQYRKLIEEYVKKLETGVTFAPVSDRRPALDTNTLAVEAFSDADDINIDEL